MLNDPKYRAFLLLAETLNYTKTARKMFVSQQTISRYISSLEKELGVYLFTRTTRTVTLTAVGELYYDLIKNLLARWESRTGEIAKIIMNEDRACVHIGLQSSMNVKPIIKIMKGMPPPPQGLLLEIHCASPLILLDDLHSKLLYAIIVIDRFIPEDYNEEMLELTSDPLYLFVSDDNVNATDDAVWTDFIKMPYISDMLSGENNLQHMQRTERDIKTFGLESSEILRAADGASAMCHAELNKGFLLSSNIENISPGRGLKAYRTDLTETAYLLFRRENTGDAEQKILQRHLLDYYQERGRRHRVG